MTDRRGFFGRMAGAVMALVGVSSKFSLEAVGQDADGSILTIDKLTYTKVNGYVFSDGNVYLYGPNGPGEVFTKVGDIKPELRKRKPCG